MLHRFIFLSFVAFVVPLGTGCAGSIKVLESSKTGGTVSLNGAEEGAREKADEHMKARCPNGYEIVEQGETMSREGDHDWRLHFACKGPSGKLAHLAF
jgi:hypothetical protein